MQDPALHLQALAPDALRTKKLSAVLEVRAAAFTSKPAQTPSTTCQLSRAAPPMPWASCAVAPQRTTSLKVVASSSVTG